MSRFKKDTRTWNLTQRRRFCRQANSLLRCLKKHERLELHYNGNRMMFRVSFVDIRCRQNNENERHIEENGDRENLNHEENVANVERWDELANEQQDDLGRNEENEADTDSGNNIPAEEEYGGNHNPNDRHIEENEDLGNLNHVNDRHIEENEDLGNLNHVDNEIVGRQGDLRRFKRVYRHTERQPKRARRAVAETSELSELRVQIKNKERAMRNKNLAIRSEKRKSYIEKPDFTKVAKLITEMKFILTELPLKGKPMTALELHNNTDNAVKKLLGIHDNHSNQSTMIVSIAEMFLRCTNALRLDNEDDEIFIASQEESSSRLPFLPQLEKLRTEFEQLRTEKEALENKLKEIVQKAT